MKGKISVWYIIIIALGVITALTVGYVIDGMVEDMFLDALRTAFD